MEGVEEEVAGVGLAEGVGCPGVGAGAGVGGTGESGRAVVAMRRGVEG